MATEPADRAVAEFLAGVEPPERRADATRLVAIYRQVTGFEPVVWPGKIIGFGRYAYRYASGHTGQTLAAGFAPRKTELVLYGLPDAEVAAPLLARLGPHKTGKGCLYVKRLDRVEEGVLRDLIRAGLEEVAARWGVTPV